MVDACQYHRYAGKGRLIASHGRPQHLGPQPLYPMLDKTPSARSSFVPKR